MAVDDLSALLQESAKADAERSALIAHLSGGRVGYAYRLAEDTEFFARRQAWMNDLLDLVRSGKNARIQYSHNHTNPSIIERAKAKIDLDEMMTFWLSFWRDVMLSCTGSSANLTNIDLEETIKRIAQTIQPKEAERAVHSQEHAFVRLQSANLQLMLDNILLGWPIVHI
jgi:DNA polymerase-3 subunit delta'